MPALLETAGERPFYRVQDGRRQVLGTDGAYRDIPRPEGVLLLSDIKLRTQPLARNGSASLWDIGDGVACLEFHSKMNALDPDILALIGKARGDGQEGRLPRARGSQRGATISRSAPTSASRSSPRTSAPGARSRA